MVLLHRRIPALADLVVDRIDARGAHLDQRLVLAQHRLGNVLDAKHVGAAERVDADGFHVGLLGCYAASNPARPELVSTAPLPLRRRDDGHPVTHVGPDP